MVKIPSDLAPGFKIIGHTGLSKRYPAMNEAAARDCAEQIANQLGLKPEEVEVRPIGEVNYIKGSKRERLG